MIKTTKPLSMAEATKFIKGKDGIEAEVKGFIKKFTKMKLENAKSIRKKIEELDLMKVKSEHISKIIDLMPNNEEDLNKIFVDVGLDKDETQKILDILKEFT